MFALRWVPGGFLKITTAGSDAIPLLSIPPSVTVYTSKVAPGAGRLA